MKKNRAYKAALSVVFMMTLLFVFMNDVSAKGNDTIRKSNIQIELRASYAFMICHHSEMNKFRSHFPVFEVSVQQTTFGAKKWHQLLNYPAIGATLFYTNVGGFKEIGNLFGIYPYMSFNFLKSQKNMLNARLGVGIGYATNKWDAKTNPQNTFLGSHVNALFSINLEYSRVLSERWQLSFYTGMEHMSNGGARCPNNGINLWQAGLNARYFIKEPKKRLPPQTIDNEQYNSWNKKNISYYFAFLYSIKDIDEYMGYGRRWSVYNLQFYAMKRVTQMSKFGVGLDLVYDETDIEILKIKEIPFAPIQILKPGINVAYELVLETTSFMFNVGYHVGGKELCEGRVYQKLNLKQSISKHIYLTFGLTTHYGWADYIGFGIGFKSN